MRQRIAPLNRANARKLRRTSTDAERRLWERLKNSQLDGLKFRRQVPIGRFIADFACYEARLVIEVDGGQHSESAHDAVRDAELSRRGFRILRFWNHEVMQSTDEVVATIFAAVRGEQLGVDAAYPLTLFL